MLKKFWYVVTFLCLVSLVFYLGYLYGLRELAADKTDNLLLVPQTGQITNSLSNVEIKPIIGCSDNCFNTSNRQTFGQIYLLVNDKDQTEVLIVMQNVPTKVKGILSGKTIEREIPTELRVDLAILTDGDQNFEYENVSEDFNTVGKIVFDGPNQNQMRQARFSTVINQPLFTPRTRKIKRIVFRPMELENPEKQNIFVDTTETLPRMVREQNQPAPFFWVEL